MLFWTSGDNAVAAPWLEAGMKRPISTTALLTPELRRACSLRRACRSRWGGVLGQKEHRLRPPVLSSVYWCSSDTSPFSVSPFVEEDERWEFPLQFCLWPVGYHMHIWREKPRETDYEELAHTGMKAEKHHDALSDSREPRNCGSWWCESQSEDRSRWREMTQLTILLQSSPQLIGPWMGAVY